MPPSSGTPHTDKLEKKLESVVERAAKMLILEINRELRKRGSGTPVDTGHARANWIPSVGSPNTQEAPGTDNSLAQAGIAKVMAYKVGQGSLYIANVVPYIGRLNTGSSQRAPALFVESCVMRAMATVKAKLGVDMGMSSYSSNVGASGAENMASAYSPFGDD